MILSRSLRDLAAQGLPEELLHDLLPQIDAIRDLLEDLHEELREEIVNYRAARAPQDQELDGI